MLKENKILSIRKKKKKKKEFKSLLAEAYSPGTQVSQQNQFIFVLIV